MGGCRNLLILWLPRTSLVFKFLCLLNLPPMNLERLPLSLISPCPPHMGAGFKFCLGSSQGCEATAIWLERKVFTGRNKQLEWELEWKEAVRVMGGTRSANRLVAGTKSVWENYSSIPVKYVQWRLEAAFSLCGQMKAHRLRGHCWTALHLRVEQGKATYAGAFTYLGILNRFWYLFRLHYTVIFIPLVSLQTYEAYSPTVMKLWATFLKYLFLTSFTCKNKFSATAKRILKGN